MRAICIKSCYPNLKYYQKLLGIEKQVVREIINTAYYLEIAKHKSGRCSFCPPGLICAWRSAGLRVVFVTSSHLMHNLFIHFQQFLALRQDPLEAILVIFDRRALIFFGLKALGKK